MQCYKVTDRFNKSIFITGAASVLYSTDAYSVAPPHLIEQDMHLFAFETAEDAVSYFPETIGDTAHVWLADGQDKVAIPERTPLANYAEYPSIYQCISIRDRWLDQEVLMFKKIKLIRMLKSEELNV